MIRSIAVATVAITLGLGVFSLSIKSGIAAPCAPLFPTTSGSLDTTFAGDGVAEGATVGSSAWEIAVQTDGKVVLVGSVITAGNYSEWLICRFNANGTIDTGFGNAGEVILFGSSNDRAIDVALDTSGRILVTGWKTFPSDPARFTVVRLTPSGLLDPTFGSGGVADVQVDLGSLSNAIAIQSDGKILVAGFAATRQQNAFAVARFHPDGSLDTQTFGDVARVKKNRTTYKGYTVHNINTDEHNQVYSGSIALQPDGKILLGGHRDYGSGITDRWQVARYNTDGTVDTSFASGGVLEGDLFGYAYVNLRAIAFHDGSLYVFVRGWGNTTWIEGFVARYTMNGALDTAYGNGGLALPGIDAEHQGKGLAFQSDGRMVICTNHYTGTTIGITTFRFTTTGVLDSTYGSFGMGQIANDAPGWALAIDGQGAIFTGGAVDVPNVGTVMAAAKFHGAGTVTELPQAPTGLSALAASSSRIDLAWIDNAINESGFEIERSPNGVGQWSEIATVGADVTTYADPGLAPETTYYYQVRAYNAVGNSDYSNMAYDTTGASVATDDLAASDIPVSGTVSGTYAATQVDDDVYQSITERESGGKPSNRYSYLEHRWTFDVTAGSTHVFHVQAYHSANSEGDDFEFAYAVSASGPWTPMVTVTKTADDDANQTFGLPAGLSGTVYVRVIDKDRNQGNRNLDTIYIDHMFIQSE